MRRVETLGVLLLAMLLAATAWSHFDRKAQTAKLTGVSLETRALLLGTGAERGLSERVTALEDRAAAMLAILQNYRDKQPPGEIIERLVLAESRLSEAIRSAKQKR